MINLQESKDRARIKLVTPGSAVLATHCATVPGIFSDASSFHVGLFPQLADNFNQCVHLLINIRVSVELILR